MFYRPDGTAAAADAIPFYKDGEFYIFYLKDFRDTEHYGEGVPWYLIKTKDFVSYTDCGEVRLAAIRSAPGSVRVHGSVIEHEGRYYLFYTGHNPHLREEGKPEQAVMLAVSDDCVHFQKTDFIFFAPSERSRDARLAQIRMSFAKAKSFICCLPHARKRDRF